MARGTYLPGEANGSFDSVLSMRPRVHIYGGFSGGESALEQRDWIANETILSADRNGDDLPGWINRSDNFWGLVTVPDGPFFVSEVVFDGLTFQGTRGEAALGITGTAQIRNCRFVGNENTHGGGAGALHYEPGVYPHVAPAELTLMNCAFIENRGAGPGACVLKGNTATPIRIYGCLFQGNVRTGGQFGNDYGQTVSVYEAQQAEVINCTFVENEGTGSTCLLAALNFRFVDAALLKNSIFWGAPCGSPNMAGFSGLLPGQPGHQVEYVCVQNSQLVWPSANIFNQDPQFVGAGDFSLAPGSPYIDAGDSFAVPRILTHDLERDYRIKDDPNAPNTGQGFTRFVDLGAFER